MKRVGVIGLGKMGRPMAQNLLRSGFDVCVYDVADAPVQELAAAGGVPVPSPHAAIEYSEAVVLSLPDVVVLRQVMRGHKGLLKADLAGKTIIDTTTATAQAAVELAEEVAARGGWMLDSPVTGGVWGAQNASLRFFVGGNEGAFAAQHDIYDALGRAVYIGANGHGQIGKMVCQMIGSVEYAVAAEALAFAENAGADANRIAQVFGEGHILHRMLSRRESGDLGHEGYTAQRGKDIDYAVEEATRSGSDIPVTRAIKAVFDAARDRGLGQCDPLALFLLWQGNHEYSNLPDNTSTSP